MPTLLEYARSILEAQHGLITRSQALAGGHSAKQLHRLLRAGVWEVIDSGLYGPTGVPMTWIRRLCGVLLLAPEGSLASHRSCAALFRVGGIDDPPIEITIPRNTTFRREGVIVHESTDLWLARPVVVDGIPSTDLRRLAMDLGAVVSEGRMKHTIREIRHGHGVTSEQLLHTYLQHKRQGRNGGGALRDWLDRYFDLDGVPESGLELVVLDALLDSGLPAPVSQYWVTTPSGTFRLDFAYVDHLVCMEVDGSQHDDEDIAVSDAERTLALEGLGWTVLRIRSKHLASDLLRVIRTLRRLHTGSVVDR